MRVLIVEDDESLQKFLKNALEAEMYAVDVAGDGTIGVQYAIQNEYDLVILDNSLPGKDGRTVCDNIRQSGRAVPILVLSAQGETEQKTALLNAGADDYLTKPFELAELKARIRALLRRPSALKEEIFTAGDLVLDITRNLVTKGGKDLNLTRKEFMLLHYLMRNPDIVLTRAMILEHVWDMTVDIFSNTIESHIVSLRKKIGDTNKDTQLIRTVPARGYKFSQHT